MPALYRLSSSKHTRFVQNPIKPFGGYSTVPGFYVIAHRGASAYAPENTLPAFIKAVELGSDMIELDITMSRDGVPVVIHDNLLHRTTNGTGRVQDFTSAELNGLDAGSWFDERFKNTPIPALEEVMAWAKKRICLNIEIKKEAANKATGDVAGILSDLIRHQDMEDQIVVSSFSRQTLQRFHKASPEVSTAMLLKSYSRGTTRNIKRMELIGARGINLSPRQMRASLMKLTAAKQVPVWVYTVDEEQEMKQCIRNGCTGIFTNKPDELRRVASDELKAQPA